VPKVFKPNGSDKYVVFYTDHTGRRRKKTLTADRKISERIAANLLEKVALRKDGLIDDRDERFAEHESKPLKEHLADYARVVAAKGATEKHVTRTKVVIQRVFDLANAKRISDLSASSIEEAIGEIRRTRCTNTVNCYVQHIKACSHWLWRDKRARDHILADLKRKDPKGDRRHIRRRLTDAEALAVINAAEHGRATKSGLSGPDHAMLYRLAHGTGFRAEELRTLTPERFRLDDDPPTVTVLGCYTKIREEAVQPIAKALADRLRPWLATKPGGQPLFEKMSKLTAAMLRSDLRAAGVPYKSSEGVADFHASRGTYISNLVSSGASVKTCQILARHADPALTIGVYAKTSVHDIQGAVENLPDLAPQQPESEALQATGTDGKPRTATQNATQDAEADEGGLRTAQPPKASRCEHRGTLSVRGRRAGRLRQ
jgi:integrase